MYSEQDCIDALQTAAKEMGYCPSAPEYDKLDISPTSRTITRKIGEGKWTVAKEVAGVDFHSEESCIESLQEADGLIDGNLGVREYKSLKNRPSAGHIINIFGSWNSAKEKAGIKTTVGKFERQCEVNVDFFENINTSKSSYWLGFIYGDGCVTNGCLKIQLSYKDYEHLKMFARDINSTYAVSKYTDPRGFEKINTSIPRKNIVNDLKEHGVVERKTFTHHLPQLEGNFIPAFIRGFFDADGNFYVNNNGNGRWSIAARSKRRLKGLNYMLSGMGISAGNIYDAGDGIGYQLEVNQRSAIGSLWEILYPNGVSTYPCLKRKTKQIQKFVE